MVFLVNSLMAAVSPVGTAPQLGKGQHKVWIAKLNDAPVGAVMEATAPDGYSGAIQSF
jgi:Na+-translocating ferredoxin:NAD+ oxidoreductase RnfG subunit